MALTQDLLRAKEFRAVNPQLTDLSDTQLADLVNKQTGELGDLAKSSALSRTVARGSNLFNQAGQTAEGYVNKLGTNYPTKVAARATNMAVSSLPEYVINLLAARVAPQSKMGMIGLGALNFGLGAARTSVEGGDTKAALGAGSGNVVSLLGALAGGKKGRALGGATGAFLGSTAGSLPGQALSIATSEPGISGFLSDPLNLPATLLSQLPYGAIDHVREQGQAAKFNREKTIAETPTLDAISNLTKAEEYVKLQKIPVSQLSEQAAERIRQLATELGRNEEARAANRAKNAVGLVDPSTTPEPELTLFHQIRMMNKGKKPAVFIPKGQEVPTVPFEMQGYLSHDNEAGHFLYNPDLTNPKAIDDAVKSDTVGNLLGYGTPKKPLNPNGYSAVLRDRNGVEKMAVVLSPETETGVLQHLGTLREGGDTVARESNFDVLQKRSRDKGLIKNYSLQQEPTVFGTEQPAGVLGRLYTEYFLDRTGAKDTSEVRLPHWMSAQNGREVMIDPPADFVKYLRSRKIEPRRLFPVNPAPTAEQSQFNFGANYALDARKFFQNTLLKNFERALAPTATKGARFQLDQNGEMGSKGALKAIEQWAPREILDHYRDAGLETLLKSDKVSFKKLSDWIQDNTPKVEVKKLQVSNETNPKFTAAAEAVHRLETAGFQLVDVEDGTPMRTVEILDRDLNPVKPENVPVHLQADLRLAMESNVSARSSDAATGKYGVEPKELKDMPGAVDILVRVPTGAKEEMGPQGKYVYQENENKVLYRGPHFGESDKNVLASVRGYMETLPSGEKVFHVFEVQSDWGQKASKVGTKVKIVPGKMPEKFYLGAIKEPELTGKAKNGVGLYRKDSNGKEAYEGPFESKEGAIKAANDIVNAYRVEGHSLLSSYETLALKAAIQHALENGATKLAISDAETAMMTEGHDRVSDQGHLRITGPNLDPAYRKPGDGWVAENTLTGEKRTFSSSDEAYAWANQQGTIKQEPGMRAAYDDRLPTIMKKLTGDKGTRENFGQHKAAGSPNYLVRHPDGRPPGSPVFKEAGKPKSSVTARTYDLSSLSPEIEKLFSLYGQQDQHDYLQSLTKAETAIEQKISDGKLLNESEFLDAVVAGDPVDKALALRYIQGLTGNPGEIKTFLADVIGGLSFRGRTVGTSIDINLKHRAEEAFATFGHEASHVAANFLKFTNPEAYRDFISFPTKAFTADQRKSILGELYKTAKIEPGDLDYLSGQKFDPKDPNLAQKQAYEFYGALSEVIARQVYRDASINPSISRWLGFLPMGAQRWLSQLVGQFTKYFGPQHPSLRHLLDGQQHEQLVKAYEKLVRFTHSNEAAQATAFRHLRRLDLFNEAQFVGGIPSMHDSDRWRDATRQMASQPDQFRDYALNFLKDSGLVKKVSDAYEENFMSPLYRTKLHPELLPIFTELHHYRNKISNYGKGYMSYIGQNAEGSLSQEQAVRNANEYIDKLISPLDPSRNQRLNAMAKVLAKNNDIREALINPTEPGKRPVGAVNESQLVSKEQMVKDFGLSPDDAEKLSRIIKIPRQVAEQTLRFMQATDTVNISKLFFLRNNKQNINAVKQKVAELTRISNDAGAQILERKIYEKYKGQLAAGQGNELKIADLESRIHALKQSEDQFRAIMENGIRQSFGADIPFDPTPGADSFITQATNLSFRLAETRAEQNFIMRDEGYAPMTRRGRFLVQVFKEGLDGGVIPGTTESMHGFKTKAEADKFRREKKLTDLNSKVLDKEVFAQRAELYSPRQLQAVRDKARTDLGEVIRAYGDALPESPQLPDQLKVLSDIMNQYHPLADEIREVISAKGDKFKERRYNVKGFDEHDFLPNIFEYADYKTIVGQKALTRAEVELQALQPAVQQDPNMQNRVKRELDYTLSHTNEASNVRKFIFYNYLGGSVRHMIQNLMQIPLNGIPEMMAQGAGMHSYGHAIKAGALAARYLKEGTTGNKQFDVLLKQAEHDGVTIPNAIEFFGSESSDLQHALDSIAAYDKGTTTLGEKAGYANTKFWQGFEKFMRSTAVASEQTNRRISFLMSLLESERTGVNDPRAMFNKANVFTDYVNFVGDKSNRPGFQVKLGQSWAHAPVLVATALQSFVLNHISQLAAYGKLAMKGDVNYQKAFATGALHLVAMAGTMGIPFAQNAEQLFEQATGISLKEAFRRGLIRNAKEMFDVQEKNGGRIADTVLQGFPSLLGIEASQSLGLGDPMFHVEAGKVPTAFDLMGPVGGLAEKYGKGLNAITANPFDGPSWREATRLVAPQALNYWMRLADATTKGSYFDRTGAPVVNNLDGQSSTSLLGGFMPKEVADMRRVQNLRYKINDRQDQDYRHAVDITAKALLEFEASGDQNALITANEQFAKYVSEMAGTQDRGTMVRSVSQRMQELKAPTNPRPSLKESREFQEALSSYPETKYPYASQLPEMFGELKSAHLLGQDDVLAMRLQGLKTSLVSKALYDSLIQAGFDPTQASRLASGGKSAAGQAVRTRVLPSQYQPAR